MQLENQIENKAKETLGKIENFAQRLEESGAKKATKHVHARFAKSIESADHELAELRAELAMIRDNFSQQITMLKDGELPKKMAELDAKIKTEQAELAAKLDGFEKSLRGNTNLVFAEVNQTLAEIKQRLHENEASVGAERSLLEKSLTELERRFGAELSKIIEWINYFNTKVD